MAISKQFIPHTELKAEDLNELIGQTNDFIVQEGNKKPDIIDIINYLSEGAILPDSSYYVHAGRPVLSTSGDYYDTRWIGFCMSHFNNLNHSIALYTRNENDRYVFYSQFRADEADTPLEEHVALVFGGLPATPTTPGLMSAQDKSLLDDVVTKVNSNSESTEYKVNALIDCITTVVRNMAFISGTPYNIPYQLLTRLQLSRIGAEGVTSTAICGRAYCGFAICGIS